MVLVDPNHSSPILQPLHIFNSMYTAQHFMTSFLLLYSTLPLKLGQREPTKLGNHEIFFIENLTKENSVGQNLDKKKNSKVLMKRSLVVLGEISETQPAMDGLYCHLSCSLGKHISQLIFHSCITWQDDSQDNHLPHLVTINFIVLGPLMEHRVC